MRAGTYVRKSNEPGEGNHSLETQRAQVAEIIERAGYTLYHSYEQIVSGWDLSADRSAMRRLISDIEAGHVQVVVVAREDRLGRRLSETARLLDVCRASGCLIHTTTGIIDPANPAQSLLYSIVSAIAENESNMISARVRATLDRLRGVSLTHGTPPYGMMKSERDENKHLRLLPNPLEAPTVVRMAELVLKDRMGAGEVSAILNREGHRTRNGLLWQYKSVQATLMNPSIGGFATELARDAPSRSPRHLQIVEVDGRPAKIHKPVLPEDEWRRIRRLLEPRDTRKRRTQRSPLLTGLVKCDRCGSAMHAGYSSGNGRVYRRYVCPGFVFQGEDRCANSISLLPLHEFIDSYVRGTLKDDNFRRALQKARSKVETPRRLRAIQDRLEDAYERTEALTKALSTVSNSRAIATLSLQLEDAENEKDRIENEMRRYYERGDDVLSFAAIFDYYESLETSRKRFAIDQVLEEIRVQPAEPGVKLNLPGVKGGATIDLSRVAIQRKNSDEWHRLPPGTLAPLPRDTECIGCLELIPRESFAEHRAECQSDPVSGSSTSSSQSSASDAASL